MSVERNRHFSIKYLSPSQKGRQGGGRRQARESKASCGSFVFPLSQGDRTIISWEAEKQVSSGLQARRRNKPGREGDLGKRLFLLVLGIPGIWGLGFPPREGLGSPEREKGGQAPGIPEWWQRERSKLGTSLGEIHSKHPDSGC